MKEMEFKAGDKVFGIQCGFVVLEENKNSFSNTHTLRAKSDTYTTDGRFSSTDKHRSLLTIEEAKSLGIEPPKKKVEVKLWTNVYPNQPCIAYHIKENADKSAAYNRIACVEMTGFYEVDDV